MPIEFVDRNKGNLHCAKWRVDFNSANGEISEQFQLPGCKSNIHFDVSCTYNKINDPTKNRIQPAFVFGSQTAVPEVTGKYVIELSLKQLNVSHVASLSSAKRDSVSDYYLQHCNVWIVTNENAKIALKRSFDTSDWHVKSEKFQVNIQNAQAAHSSLTFEMWIESKSFGQGEIKALTHMADYLFVRQTHCDVHFTFEDGQQIGAHVHILSARSAVFAAMFTHDMQETKTGKVVVKDIKSDIFKELLHYIYMGRTKSPLTDDTAQQLFLAVDKYDIADLRNECVDHLISSIKLKNAINIMIWAHLHAIDNVKKAALDIVVRNAKEICLTEEWERLANDYPDLNVLATRCIINSAQFNFGENELTRIKCNGRNKNNK